MDIKFNSKTNTLTVAEVPCNMAAGKVSESGKSFVVSYTTDTVSVDGETVKVAVTVTVPLKKAAPKPKAPTMTLAEARKALAASK